MVLVRVTGNGDANTILLPASPLKGEGKIYASPRRYASARSLPKQQKTTRADPARPSQRRTSRTAIATAGSIG